MRADHAHWWVDYLRERYPMLDEVRVNCGIAGWSVFVKYDGRVRGVPVQVFKFLYSEDEVREFATQMMRLVEQRG